MAKSRLAVLKRMQSTLVKMLKIIDQMDKSLDAFDQTCQKIINQKTVKRLKTKRQPRR